MRSGSTTLAVGQLDEQQRRFESSGKTAIAFCQDEGVVLSTFYQRRARWKKQRATVQAKSRKQVARFVDAGEVMAAAPLPVRAQVAREISEHVEVRLELGGGVVLYVTRS